MPQMPMPTASRYAIDIIRTLTSANAIAKPNHQPSDVLRVSTIALILSVTVAKVWPGAMTGTGLVLRRPARALPATFENPVLRHLSSGLSSVMAARYVVLGRVFSSCSRA